ncbi:hypothetical protein ACPWT1_09560 [Ramlibacter sp. MMS24-I3-19]|uniref:hypothetical protein n=1 Tax=Ramlibacter sp. MMS24-I3-19 TaxID=3416606 RepID=UPI003D072F9A
MQRLLPVLALATVAAAVQAKLPPPDPAAKAKTEEAAAKTAWQAKVDSYQLCKVQDKIAAKFGHKGAAAKSPAPAASESKTATSTPAGGAAPSPTSGSNAAVAAEAKASAPAPAAADKTTPVSTAGAPPAPCADPGPFAYNPPQQTPLETSEAHSPAGTATKPPSVRPESGTMVPGKK